MQNGILTKNGTSPAPEKQDMFLYDISVVILTYHPAWEKLRQTVLSAVYQQGIRLEIIVADDGSTENFREKLESLFESLNFTDYRLVMNEVNHGTIANYLSGLNVARGEYTRAISPGDFLSGKNVLRDWLSYMRREGFEWTFSDAVYYQDKPEGMRLVPAPPFPVYRGPYFKKDLKKCRWNYAVLDDAALGATMMGKTTLIHRYILELMAIGNKYCEDYIFRMMMYDGVCGGYYPADTVFYECTSGISSSGNQVWQQRIIDEFLQMSRLLAERKNPDAFQQKMLSQIRKKTSMKAMIRIPGKIRRALLFKLIRRKPRLDFTATEAWRRSLSPAGQ